MKASELIEAIQKEIDYRQADFVIEEIIFVRRHKFEIELQQRYDAKFEFSKKKLKITQYY